MKALEVFAIYVTPFLIIGAAIKLLMKRYALDLSDVKNAGSKPRRRFSARSLAYRRIRTPLRMLLEDSGRPPLVCMGRGRRLIAVSPSVPRNDVQGGDKPCLSITSSPSSAEGTI